MIIRVFLLGFGLCLYFTGCRNKEVLLPGPDDSLIYGLASPVLLDTGMNTVVLEDYFPSGVKADSITCEGLKIYWSSSDSIIQIQSPEEKSDLHLYEIHIYVKEQRYSIPVFSGNRQKVHFRTSIWDSTMKEAWLSGSFNNWNGTETPLIKENEQWLTTLYLKPGKYAYQIMGAGNKWTWQGPDPNNKQQESNGMGGINSILEVDDVPKDQIPFIATEKDSGEWILFSSTHNLRIKKAYWQNSALEVQSRANGHYVLKIPKQARNYSRSWIRIYGANETSRSNDILVALDHGKVLMHPDSLDRSDWEATVMYFPMIDRFYNGNKQNDEPLNDPGVLPKANYMGGDLVGILSQLRNGYFEQLGVSTLWLSPVTQNPLDAWGQFKDPDTRFSGYHGYWPISSSKVDHRFGNNQVLKTLIEEAHKRKINVILDYVANHVHRSHPLYQQHPNWATSLYLSDGTLNTERWDEYRLTTWFDTFMPTLDLEKQYITEYMTDSALFWVKEMPFDGFRHDATKHIPLNFWRTLNKKIKNQVALPQNKRLYQIGETYGSHELIGSYLGSGLLDAQFDFNMYDAALPVLSGHDKDLNRLGQALTTSLKTYGYHHLMGNISGNQDKPRFISYADQSLDFSTPWMEYKRKGWKESIGISDSNAYRKMALMHAWNMGIPGIPVIYYGDEIGMPGAGDPDNRRMMRFDSLNTQEYTLRQEVAQMAQLRKNWLPLSFGSTRIICQQENCIVIERLYFTQKVWVIISGEDADFRLNISLDKSWKLSDQFGDHIELTPTKLGQLVQINSPYSYAYVYFEKK